MKYLSRGVVVLIGSLLVLVGALMWSEWRAQSSERHRRLELVTAAVDEFRRATGSWPTGFKEMAPPECRNDGCVLTSAQLAEALASTHVLRPHDGGLEVCFRDDCLNLAE